MWCAQVAPGYHSTTEAFDTEAEATAWCEREMRAAGTGHGVVFWIGEEA